jgi:glycosyltransferase involved in cell wall biosynthesis
MDISVVLPCRNERETVGICIDKINSVLKNSGRTYEIIVSDSSVDGSDEIARRMGVKVVKHDKIGYGRAYLEGMGVAKGKYIIMGDADDTYNFREVLGFVEWLDRGADLVLGSRFKGMIEDGAMPWLHKHIGNPFLSNILNMFFGMNISDTQSGFRAIKKVALDRLNLRMEGMEFASEMLIKAKRERLKIKEIPIHYYPRVGESKLDSFNDGWKHLRFMLLYSPNYLFFIPGLFLFVLGMLVSIVFLFPPVNFFGLNFFTHPMLIASFISILGYQIILLGVFAKTYAHNYLGEKSYFVYNLNRIMNLERALIVGGVIFVLGIIVFTSLVFSWINSGYLNIISPNISVFSLTLMLLGMQTWFSAFLLSILGIKER